MIIKPFMITCPARSVYLENTLASWRETDWPGEPTVIVDNLCLENRQESQTRNAKRLLETAAAEEGFDYLLFLEDDLEFNRHLYHNLQRWSPIRHGYLRAGGLYSHLQAGAYAPHGFRLCPLESASQSQAILLHASLIPPILEAWDRDYSTEMQDLRIWRTAQHFCPVGFFHYPSLVQHVGEESTWGGPSHHTGDFSKEFKEMSFSFIHGMGDCANYCFQIPLYTRRGHKITVHCTPEKRAMFEAAGAEVIGGGADSAHPYLHADHEPPTLENPWSGSKPGWNVARSPAPNIGDYRELWEEYCAIELDLEKYITPEIRVRIAEILKGLPRPIILLHLQGNTSPGMKDLPHDQQAVLIRSLLSRTDGTVISLDWDRRVWTTTNARFRNMMDWHAFNPLELYEIISKADLLIGVDSGVQHFSRFTKTPVLGLWRHNSPSHFALPRAKTAHLVGNWNNALTRLRRIPFNIIEAPGNQLDGNFIAEQAVRMIGPRYFLENPGPDLLLRSLIDNCQGEQEKPEWGRTHIDRTKTLELLFWWLKDRRAPLVLETGTIRAEEDYSAGFFTYICGLFLKHHGGLLASVELDKDKADFARKWTKGLPVKVWTQHSHDFLTRYDGPPLDAIYLDSCDTDFPEHASNCLEEAKLALPHLAKDGMVLIDDTPNKAGVWHGKGSLAIPWLLENGFRVVFAGYQVLLQRVK